MNWNIRSGNAHEFMWLSSLDYRTDFEVVYMAEYGNLDQGESRSNPEISATQRPALT